MEILQCGDAFMLFGISDGIPVYYAVENQRIYYPAV